MKKRVFAIAAHPDDIEFGMAGTLFLLKEKGWRISYMNIANGSCGSMEENTEAITKKRLEEAKNACKKLGGRFFPPITNDIEIFYGKELLARIGSIIREVEPDILLVPAPSDYMEDHMIAGRLAVTAAFCRNMPNFPVDPPMPYTEQPVAVYHAQPAGNKDYTGQLVKPDFFVDITEVMDRKTDMLSQHKSQKEWLDKSQGLNAYLENMKQFSKEMGEMAGRCDYAEGWRRHNHLGFCNKHNNILQSVLAEKCSAA
jgi:N-acetylglucosamine malate deacetylase 1